MCHALVVRVLQDLCMHDACCGVVLDAIKHMLLSNITARYCTD